MTPETLSRIGEIAESLRAYGKEYQQAWREGVLFTWQWWLLAALTVLPWAAWIVWHKKNSTNRLLFAGFFTIIVAKLLDALGSTFGLWEYTAKVIPLIPPYLPWDTTMMPVAVMTFIQFRPKINPYIKAVVFAGIAAFVMEPLAVLLQLYKPIIWKHIYSFPIFAAIYLVADWLAKRGRFDRLTT